MKKLNKWVDVRKKQVREVTDMDITIKKLEEKNTYITLKEVKAVEQPYSVYINGERVKKLDKDFTIIEYTPLDKKHNVRIHVNDKKEILEYYFDIIAENKIKDGIPFYNDLYLDVVYFQPAATKEGTYIQLVDCNELEEALKENIIDKEQFDMAYIEAEKLMKELKEKKNMTYIFICHDLALVELLCDKVIVLNKGNIVESGDAKEIINNPIHPYTKLLVNSIFPVKNKNWNIPDILIDEQKKNNSFCKFYNRCNNKSKDCLNSDIKLQTLNKNHFVKCNNI